MLPSSNILSALLDGPFTMRSRPEPLPGDLRFAWGVALVVLLLGYSRAQRASLQKLHFLAHSIRTEKTREQAEEVLSGRMRPSDFIVRVEPWLNRAIAFARASELVQLKSGKSVELTTAGRNLFRELSDRTDALQEEKAFLQQARSTATERSIDKIMRMELSL
jgi:hypothetical protein